MNKSISPTEIFLAVLAVLLISVSFYQTWLGLEQIFSKTAIVISLVLSLLLLFLLYLIRSLKSRGENQTAIVWIYTFIALFCFVANFNAIYTHFMKTDIYKNEARVLNEKFNTIENDIESKLSYSIPDPKTRQDIRSEVNSMKIQIKDPKNKGIGPEAKAIIQRIEKLLGKKVTPLTPISNDMAGYEDLADRMEEQIMGMVYTLTPEERSLLSDAESASLKWTKNLQNLLSLSKEDINSIAPNELEKAIGEYNKIGSRAQSVLGSDKYQFENLKSNVHEVGKIGYAFEHAMKNFGIYTLVALAGCFVLDFLMVILVTKIPSGRSGNNRTTGTRREPKILTPQN